MGRRAVRFVVRGYARAIASIAATGFAGGLVEALFLITVTRAAFAIANGEERIAVSSSSFSVRSTLFIAVGLVLIRLALAGYASWQSARVSTRVVAQIRQRVTRAFLEASWEVQQAQPSGSLQELLTTYSAQASSLMGSVSQGVVAIANLVALLGMAFAIDPAGALVLVVSVTGLGLLIRPLRSVIRRRAQSAATAGMMFALSVNEISELGFELQVFNVQGMAEARVGEAIEHTRKATLRMLFASGLSSPLYTGLAYLAIVGALAIIDVSTGTKLTSIGATMLVMLRSLSYGQGVQGAYLATSGAIPAIEELQRRLEAFDAGRRVELGQPVGRVGAVSMDRVSFAYPQSEAVLRDVSFTISPNEIIGIVGP
ncbi:MAG: ABC transporter ATP-binding protein/permease, partial [Actinobacteria bacterium]|nr:ABC transporter ATP-binding protein/permease [Actinomycetota bacterium]